MKTTKMIVIAALMMLGTIGVSAQDATPQNDIIKLNEQQVPVCFVNKTIDELRAAHGDLETILETPNFQLYQAGEYSYKVEGGLVVSQSIQFEDPKDEKILYNKILSDLQKTKFIKDSHNSGGNNYMYTDFQVQFDDFQGYQKLTFSVLPAEGDLTEK
jgi:hypothetical protein